MIEENENNPEFNINCVDPLNRSALIAAIENENAELIYILLEAGIKVQDALLHAIKEEYVEAVEILLQFEEQHHVAGEPYSWEAVDRAQSTFTPDITPLVLAAHMNNYEIIKILLDRGASLPTPHDVRCGCDGCVTSSSQDSLRHSQARINSYRALSSSSLIALSSRDPLLTAFELSWELRRLSRMENEFRDEYNFVAHPNVQQLLASMWYDGLPGFRRKTMVRQMFDVGKLGAMFPVYSTMYLMAPKSEMADFMSKPFVKFICHSASYAFFLMLLGAASQRVEFLVLEWFGPPWVQEMLLDWKRRERGSLPGIVESGVVLYVFSQICWETRSIWSEGLLEYVNDPWNMVDFASNMFYVTWIALRATSYFISWREWWNGWDPYYPREQWDPFDPMLLSEGMFAAGMIFSFLKLVHIFSVNPHLGPLQISLGRMIIDIIKFFFIYTLVLFAFGCGMNQLMWYYADLDKKKCYHLPDGSADFDNEDMACTIWRRFANLFETSQSLFWASFGMVDLMSFELTGCKSFTRFWALLMFGSYSVINIIVLLNMLIAMMSNSYQIISERSDVEWKFARSKLWMSYFEEGDVVPPPFNLMPGVSLMLDLCNRDARPTSSVKVRSRERALERHDAVMGLLVRRYVTAEQRKRDDFGITEDDVMEIRQDISTLRFEIVDILRNNGMKTPTIEKSEQALHGKKGKVMERRLLKDFQIGYVEGVVNDALSSDKGAKDVFSKIAQAIGKRKNTEVKKDWNAEAKRRNSRRELIGSTSEMTQRRASQQSLRRYIIENEKKDMKTLDPNKLVEYNPRLRDVSPATRVAYTKFKMRKIKEEYEKDEDNEAAADDVFENTTAPNGHVNSKPSITSRKDVSALVRTARSIVRYTHHYKSANSTSSANKDVVVQMEPEAVTPKTASNAPPTKTEPPPIKVEPPPTTVPITKIDPPPPPARRSSNVSTASVSRRSTKKVAPIPDNPPKPAEQNKSKPSPGAWL
ncbi:hypothetical protein B566_EDAN000831 [Ephemera danica]|nr:hypothetical protein B566_EDAN000831 [Ephemera danica]